MITSDLGISWFSTFSATTRWKRSSASFRTPARIASLKVDVFLYWNPMPWKRVLAQPELLVSVLPTNFRWDLIRLFAVEFPVDLVIGQKLRWYNFVLIFSAFLKRENVLFSQESESFSLIWQISTTLRSCFLILLQYFHQFLETQLKNFKGIPPFHFRSRFFQSGTYLDSCISYIFHLTDDFDLLLIQLKFHQ